MRGYPAQVFSDPSEAFAPGFLAASAGAIYLALVSVPLAITDARLRRLPNRLVLPGGVVALAGQVVACTAFGGSWWRLLLAMGLAAAVFGIGLWFVSTGALGMGDAKLLAVLALSLGWHSVWAVAVVVFAGFALSFVHAALMRRNDWRSPHRAKQRGIPLGTHLMVSYLASAVAWGLAA